MLLLVPGLLDCSLICTARVSMPVPSLLRCGLTDDFTCAVVVCFMQHQLLWMIPWD
jgi:hypothetical protein